MKTNRSNLALISIVAMVAACLSALAATQFQIISPNVSPKMVESFTSGGRAHGSGGLIMQGVTSFVNGDELNAIVSSSEVRLSITNDGHMCLIYQSTCFVVDLDSDLVNPLIGWVLNGTETAFSNTEGRSKASRRMREDGLVEHVFYQGAYAYGSHYIAKKLDNDRIFDLLRDADYAQSGLVESLPGGLERQILNNYNIRISTVRGTKTKLHSTWTNADYNTVYTTVLKNKTATTYGRPLRYYWTEFSEQKALKITSISLFRDPETTQDDVLEDIVRMYQATAILRTLASVDRTQLIGALNPQ